MIANNAIFALPATAESIIKIDNSRGGETYEIFHDSQAYACWILRWPSNGVLAEFSSLETLMSYVAENICRTTF